MDKTSRPGEILVHCVLPNTKTLKKQTVVHQHYVKYIKGITPYYFYVTKIYQWNVES